MSCLASESDAGPSCFAALTNVALAGADPTSRAAPLDMITLACSAVAVVLCFTERANCEASVGRWEIFEMPTALW